MPKKAANNELENQDPIQAQKDSVREYMRKLRSNTITLGADLIEVRVQEGKEKLDKDTRLPIVNEETGEVERWSNKYYAKFAFMGGEVETEIKGEQYPELSEQIGMPFYLQGRLTKVRSFGSEIVAPVFSNFELLA